MKAARPFRAHTELPESIASLHAARPVLAALVREWVDLCSRPATARTVQRWSRLQPTLEGADSLGELVDAIDRADYSAKDAAISTLLLIHQEGSTLAGRALLQLLLPQLANVGSRVHRQSSEAGDDGDHLAVATFWDVLGDYRPQDASFASLASTTRSRIWRQLERDRAHAHVEPAASDYLGTVSFANMNADDVVIPAGELDADGDLEMLISWAISSGVITSREAKVLVVGLCSGQGRIDQLAGLLDCSNASARQQLSRIRARVIGAARESLQSAAAAAA